VSNTKLIILTSIFVLVIVSAIPIIIMLNSYKVPNSNDFTVSNTTTTWNYFTTTPISYQNPSCNLIEDKNYMGWKGTDELPNLFTPSVIWDLTTIWAKATYGEVSLKTVVELSDVIIIGKVTGIKELSIEVSGDFEKYGMFVLEDHSLKYTVLVEKVIKGNLTENEYIEVIVDAYLSKNYFDYKNNITIQGKDLNPSLVASLFPLLNVGNRYILFLWYFDEHHNIQSPYRVFYDLTFGYFAYLITDDNKVYSLNNIKYPVRYDFASILDNHSVILWYPGAFGPYDLYGAIEQSKKTFGACGVSLDQFLSQLS